MSFFSEFKAFLSRGNVIDLSVAVVMGAEFGKIISSFVQGIVMPLIGLLSGGVDIAGMKVTIGQAVIQWGSFVQAIVNFLIIAFAIFVVIRLLEHFRKKKTIKPPEDVLLLRQIRDLLKDNG